jgi:hypothetical protein
LSRKVESAVGARLLVFLTAMVLGGLGGAIGSILGNAGGRRMLFIGGFLGGVLAAPLTARIARWRRWIAPERETRTALGAAVGFIAAATIAVNTLSSPVGPVLSTLLVGLGAVLGAGPTGRESSRPDQRRGT